MSISTPGSTRRKMPTYAPGEGAHELAVSGKPVHHHDSGRSIGRWKNAKERIAFSPQIEGCGFLPRQVHELMRGAARITSCQPREGQQEQDRDHTRKGVQRPHLVTPQGAPRTPPSTPALRATLPFRNHDSPVGSPRSGLFTLDDGGAGCGRDDVG